MEDALSFEVPAPASGVLSANWTEVGAVRAAEKPVYE